MILIKLFETTDMPVPIFERLRRAGSFVRGGTISYTISVITDGDRPEDEGQEGIWLVDSWLIAHGACKLDTVLIHHGDWFSFKVPE